LPAVASPFDGSSATLVHLPGSTVDPRTRSRPGATLETAGADARPRSLTHVADPLAVKPDPVYQLIDAGIPTRRPEPPKVTGPIRARRGAAGLTSCTSDPDVDRGQLVPGAQPAVTTVDTLTRSRRAMVAADTADTAVTATPTSPATCRTLIPLVAGGPTAAAPTAAGRSTLRDGLLFGWSTSSRREDPGRRRDLAQFAAGPGTHGDVEGRAESVAGLLLADPPSGRPNRVCALREDRVFSPPTTSAKQLADYWQSGSVEYRPKRLTC